MNFDPLKTSALTTTLGRRSPTSNRHALRAAALCAVIVLAACGGGGTPSDDIAREVPQGVVQTKHSAPAQGQGGDTLAAPSAAEACSSSRAYGLTPIYSDPAWANASGTGQPRDRSEALELWTLQVNEIHAEYIAESVAGGCRPTLEFTTKGTTGALGEGQSSYRAKVQVQQGEVLLRRRIAESASFPMSGCEGIICQQFTDYVVELELPIELGVELALSSRAVAIAIAGGTSTSDQAHADWQLYSPLIRIPIP